MDIAGLTPTTKVVLGLAGLLILYRFAHSLALAQRRRSFAKAAGCLPPPEFPQCDKVFGIDVFRENLRMFKAGCFLDCVNGRFAKAGSNTYWMIALGTHFINTIEPENLKTIQAKEFKKWSLGTRRKTAFLPLLGTGIFTSDGAAWQHSREMLRPNFTRSQIGDLPTFEVHVKQLIAAIPRDGTTVDLSELFFRLTIDSATEFLFGESCSSLSKSSSSGFALAFNRSQEYIANSARWGKLAAFFPANSAFKQDSQFVHGFVDNYVKQGLAKRPQLFQQKTSEGRYLFIDELLRHTTDPLRIRSELLNILLAGRDTTASLLTNVWHVLARRPDLWTKLQSEIAPLQGHPPTFEELKSLKYLRALLNESLRVHPVVPANSRQALEDTTLPLGGGPDGKSPLFIRKGEIVSWNLYALHRRRDFFGPDADTFRPERWFDDPVTGAKGLRPGWEYLPFNGGARICLGQQFALTEASYCTVRLCQAFGAVESRDDRRWTEGLTLTCVSAYGALVGLTPR